MRGAYEFAEQILNGEISWSDVPEHLLERTKEFYAKLKAEHDKGEYIHIPDSAVMEWATSRWDK